MIRLNSLNKFYNKGRLNEVHAVNNIDMALPEKGMIAFFGKSGCGKTTLFNKLTGAKQHVGNFPGVTVDRKDGAIRNYPNTKITDILQPYTLN